MKKSLVLLSFALASTSALAGGTVQIAPGSSITLDTTDGQQTTIQCAAPVVTPPVQYLCKARCHAGNNSYYDTDVQDYFSSRTDGVPERLQRLCFQAMPNDAQRTGARVSDIGCSVAQ